METQKVAFRRGARPVGDHFVEITVFWHHFGHCRYWCHVPQATKSPREIDSLLTGVPEPYVGIVPDRHGTGTNALLLSPPGAIVPSFGEGSCERHVAAARDAGIPFEVEEVASLGLDLDTPADVIALTRQIEAGSGRAGRTARVLGI